MSKRMSLILPDPDEALVEPFTRPGTDEHTALKQWAANHGMTSIGTEAAALRALLRAGIDAVSETALDIAYAQLAVTYNDDHADDERRTALRRYAERAEHAT